MAGTRSQIRKLLVCNRGEIAIRVFRACNELGIRTVAIYSHEDRFSLHRYKADEAYQSGEPAAPVQSYLDIEQILGIARRVGVDAIHPGYGFLSERVELSEGCRRHGILFVGPSSDTLRIAGDKRLTRELAQAQNIPTVPGMESEALEPERIKELCASIGYPVIIKAAFGGGGRGMRVVANEAELASALDAASQEALAVFGKGEVFVEKYIARPKHIEVQLLGDGTGSVVHLFERDCSVQRRHQKVIEFAPAIALPPEAREQLLEYAVRLGKALSLKSAATAEFLVAEDGSVYFIEINPRIQVEHTVTEEITDVDIVQSQLQIAAGATLEELGLRQEEIRPHGVAIQCRITTEDPTNNFTPEYGRLVTYRSASGFGIRLDAGSAFTGAEITPYYDSLLVKVTSHGKQIRDAAARLRRALREFRIRGVSTNIAFLENLLRHGEFLSGHARTSMLEEQPELFVIPERQDRATRLLRFLAEVTVNGHELMPSITRPAQLRDAPLPSMVRTLERASMEDRVPVRPKGWRDVLQQEGRAQFLQRIRDERSLLITDTTLRDAHQSLLATRMRTHDMLKVAEALSYAAPKLFSLEMWGGATFDVMLRFLREDPWDRLMKLREAAPNLLFQMLLRGSNGVGYTRYPDNVIAGFIKESAAAGIDIFRIFDSLNNIDRMRGAIAAVREAGAIAECCICFTGDLLGEEAQQKGGKEAKFTVDYYLALARALVSEGADIIAIKDMAGLLRPYGARLLVSALREELSVPIHFHTHDTAGVQTASYLAASEVGVDIVDCAFSSMAGVTSQPPLEGIVAALQHTERDTGMELRALTEFSAYWEGVRSYYAPFESDLKTSTGEVYFNEIPGGQYSNFRPQAENLGLGDQWSELKRAYAAVNELLGGIVKVTPSSKIVGDLALFMVQNRLSIDDVRERARTLNFPASVVEFFRGDIGVPYGGFPEPLRSDILRGAAPTEETPLPPADLDQATHAASELLGSDASMRDALSYLLYPHVFKSYAAARRDYGALTELPTLSYFYGLVEGEEIQVDIEPGKTLFIRLSAVSEPGEQGERTVFFELNGQPRSISVLDRKVAPDRPKNPQADSQNPDHIAAPLAGVVVRLDVREGDAIAADAPLCTIEAMKMQTVVRAVRPGRVARVHVDAGSKVAANDLLLEIAES